MAKKYKNLVFGGAGVLGISYLGVLDYLYNNNLMESMERVAGTSAGAITACMASFRLPFDKLLDLANSLDFKKVAGTKDRSELALMSSEEQLKFRNIFGDIGCLLRLMKEYGWFSSDFFYDWLKRKISLQFKQNLKSPPYTFADFKNPEIHVDNKPFLDLYIIGTDVTNQVSTVFSYNTTPDMEVAEAVRISMSIPLFFEAIRLNNIVFSDGGILRNYPIDIFDTAIPSGKNQIRYKVNTETLGITLKGKNEFIEIDSFVDFVKSLINVFKNIQQDSLLNSPEDFSRSIIIDGEKMSPIDFDISPNDEKYQLLYSAGFKAAQDYFSVSNRKMGRKFR